MTKENNKLIQIAIQQNLLLWQLTNSMIDIEKKISESKEKLKKITND
jgi:hypothetical protein